MSTVPIQISPDFLNREYGPFRTTQNFQCLFCQKKKNCQQVAISSANDFLHFQKFLQPSPNFKDSVEKLWRPPTSFGQAAKSFVP